MKGKRKCELEKRKGGKGYSAGKGSRRVNQRRNELAER